jgi:hypothetical protein
VFGNIDQTPVLIMINMIKLISISILILLASACNSKKIATENNNVKSIVLPDSIYRFNVSFISIGSGIDSKAKQQFNEFITQFNNKNKLTIIPEIVSWGREGETDYCLKLAELSSELQNKFITDTKKLLKTSKLIRYKENSTCKQNRK